LFHEEYMLQRLYPITDTHLSQLPHLEQIRQLAAGGAALIQLRDKRASPREFFEAARESVNLARSLGVRIIVNDRVDIAMAAGADGVHLGQDDFPPEKARQLLGPDKIIGYSTHSLRQALEADLLPVDYIAIGPVFSTSTKENPDPVIGLENIRQVKDRISKPLVAIGGITLNSAKSVIQAGADSLAVISDLYLAGTIRERVQAFLRSLD
jgi:thiamine-phosphate pyrophosphorylase